MKKILLLSLSACTISSPVCALNFDQTITAIFGSGNPDTGWTTGTDTGGFITLGLRAKNRDDGSTPNTDGVYAFSTGYSLNAPALALWNFEFSINVGAQSLSSYDFYLGVDLDPTLGVNYVNSLINPLSLTDNSYGIFSTPNGQGTEYSSADAFANGDTIAQNSLNIVFAGLDPSQTATYDYRLFALAKDEGNAPLPDSGGNPIAQNNTPIADVNIRVVVESSESATTVPDAGSTLALIALSMAGLAGFGSRKQT